MTLVVEYVGYSTVAARAWELRGAVTVYDATSIAVAEEVDAPLATLDVRLTRSPGPREVTTGTTPDARGSPRSR